MTLRKPKHLSDDKEAYELVRLWASNGKLITIMDLGRFAEMGIDEREAWGKVLSDFVRHAARGLSKKYGWDEERTKQTIVKHFQQEAAAPTTAISQFDE